MRSVRLPARTPGSDVCRGRARRRPGASARAGASRPGASARPPGWATPFARAEKMLSIAPGDDNYSARAGTLVARAEKMLSIAPGDDNNSARAEVSGGGRR
ncbi:hypothetical protein BN12_1010009 [Nostocoides japonicum T1-X7]|uniref:Uncharacterized protein n=1 Tax=Nostocoides japonicum T1-X7 TaxID=1194083 RepID=A0A077LU09_9MICO|nr:hypothetical protein BN12_1010009 [Tetrasphaera japonica T1-X7]